MVESFADVEGKGVRDVMNWSTNQPPLAYPPPEIAGVPYAQGIWKPLVSLNKAGD